MKKKVFQKNLIAVLAVMFFIVLIPAEYMKAESKPGLNVNRVVLMVGEKKQLRVKNITQKVLWSSDNLSVASVNKNGKVTAKHAGKAVIYAKFDNQRLKCVVIVREGSQKSELVLGNQSEDILWTVSCNGNKEDSVRYLSESGEWKRPLGLYSYAADSRNFFVDDSANGRIIWYHREGRPDYMKLPKGMVCHAMSYRESTNTLFLLLFDNIAVEPQGVLYYKADLSAGPVLEKIGMRGYDTILNNSGKPVSSGSYAEADEKLLDQAEKITGQRMDSIKQNGQIEDYKLYVCRTLEQRDSMRLLLVKGNRIVAFTKSLYTGKFSGGANQTAYMYEQDGKIMVNYMAQDINDEQKLMVIQPKFFERRK